ncbi:MAG: cation transporter [Deltaproteobacteria bacterium]|nr:cation transporter [Deltaproteobacteria bacterium]
MTLALLLTSGYMVAEAIGGFVSGSLALLADAGHMLSDAVGLALAVFAMWMAGRRATAQRTYGFHRTEIIAALANATTLIAIAISILVEAALRLRTPAALEPRLMMTIAAGGLVVNLACLGILHTGRDESLNQQGAWLHVLSDALGSVGALASGAAAAFWGVTWADPVASALIALLVLRSSWSLLTETVAVLMENAPAHVEVTKLREAMLAQSKVDDVHDLHVWTITSGLVCLSAHVVTTGGADEQQAALSSC